MQVVGTTTKPQFSDKNKQTIVAFWDTVNNAQKAVIRLEKKRTDSGKQFMPKRFDQKDF